MRCALACLLTLIVTACGGSGGASTTEVIYQGEPIDGVLRRVDMGEGVQMDVFEEGDGIQIAHGVHFDFHMVIRDASTGEVCYTTMDAMGGPAHIHGLYQQPGQPTLERAFDGLKHNAKVVLHLPWAQGWGENGLGADGEVVVPPYMNALVELDIVYVYGPDEPH